MKKIVSFSFVLLLVFGSCFDGGYIDSIFLIPNATNFTYDEFYVICPKQNKDSSVEGEKEEVEYIPYSQFRGGCDVYGETSQFYLFHLFPVSGTLDPEYAFGTLIQKYEGDTVINIRGWHAYHYYNLLGQVRVFQFKGNIIKFQLPPDYRK